MLILIHGNGLVAASQKVSQLKSGFELDSIQVISLKETSLEKALMDISTTNLFVEKRLIILEDLDEKIDLERISLDPETTLIIKFPKALTSSSTVLKQAVKQKAQVFSFTEKDEVEIFPFLDALSEKNSKVVFTFLDKILEKNGGQYLLTMIIFMLRRLVSPPQKLPPFVLQKITKQQKNFGIEKIKQLYKVCLETDYKIKNGLIDEKNGLTLIVSQVLR